MILMKLFQPIQNTSTLCFASTTIAILETLASNSISLADKLPPSTSIESLADGMSLYGESSLPDIVGKEYLVFEKLGNKTIGAFYLPQSEFSCFYGNFKGSELSITLIDGYDGQQYSYSLALHSGRLTANNLPMMGTPTYQPLEKVSDNDRRILTICKEQLRNYW
jgi:hypothetical protein